MVYDGGDRIATEGEICISGDKLYESGKNSCFEYVDYIYKSKYQFFNGKGHRVLQESSVASAYKCDVDTDTGELSNCSKYNNQLPVCVNDASTSTSCIEDAADDTYCIKSNNIYKNMQGSCTLETTTTLIPDTNPKYYYFDKEFKLISEIDTNSKIYASYECVNGGSVACTPLTEKSKGDVIRTPNSVKMCIGPGISIPLLNDSIMYDTFNADAFAGLSAGIHTYKTIGKGIIYIDETETEGLPECDPADPADPAGRRADPADPADLAGNPPKADDVCKSGGNEVSYCIYNNAIYKTDKSSGNKCDVITATAKGSYISYYDKDYNVINSVSTTSKIRYAYKCSFGDGPVIEECTLLRGYTISGSYVVMCSGSTYDDCIVLNKGSTSACKANNGSIKLGGSAVCFGTNEVTLPAAAATDPKYIAFKSTGLNPAYGVSGSGGFVFLELTSSYAIAKGKETK